MKRKPAKLSRPRDDMTLAIGRALRRAARRARETARRHDTPIYVSKDGKVVAIKRSCHVIPAQAGIQFRRYRLVPGRRRGGNIVCRGSPTNGTICRFSEL